MQEIHLIYVKTMYKLCIRPMLKFYERALCHNGSKYEKLIKQTNKKLMWKCIFAKNTVSPGTAEQHTLPHFDGYFQFNSPVFCNAPNLKARTGKS